MCFIAFDYAHALSATSTHFRWELMLYCLHCPTLNKVFLLLFLLFLTVYSQNWQPVWLTYVGLEHWLTCQDNYRLHAGSLASVSTRPFGILQNSLRWRHDERTSLTIVYSTVYSDANQRKHQSSASLAFVRGIHRGPLNSPHKWPVTRKMFPFNDVIMWQPHGRANRTERGSYMHVQGVDT